MYNTICNRNWIAIKPCPRNFTSELFAVGFLVRFGYCFHRCSNSSCESNICYRLYLARLYFVNMCLYKRLFFRSSFNHSQNVILYTLHNIRFLRTQRPVCLIDYSTTFHSHTRTVSGWKGRKIYCGYRSLYEHRLYATRTTIDIFISPNRCQHIRGKIDYFRDIFSRQLDFVPLHCSYVDD